MEILIQVVLLAIGFVMLIKGADWFVEGTSGFAERFGIPQLIIGLTIVAMGTSMPEAAVSVAAALKGSAGIAIGNVMGSNILNILIILGITAVILALPVGKSTVQIELPFMIGISILLLVFCMTGNQIDFREGILLWTAFIAYLAYLLIMAKRNREEITETEKRSPIWKLLICTAGGLGLIILGSDMTVDAATKIATAWGMSERFIGLTIVAFGTSLPELVTSVSAAVKGKADIAIGNIVGSNIFNILFVLGTSALITSIPFEGKFFVDGIIVIAAGVFLWLAVLRGHKLGRAAGGAMLAGYAAYFIYLIQ